MTKDAEEFVQVVMTAPAMSEGLWTEVQERLRRVHRTHAAEMGKTAPPEHLPD